MTNKSKSPWPTKAVMHQIYEQHFWGGKDFDFYSGDGSHDSKITEPYLKSVINFFESQPKKLTICDLGCGDFNIGKHLVPFAKKYIAIDIVEALIERNKKQFELENLEFHCLDISKDALPEADCIILRQVLQHLSNKEILQILEKLENYKLVILTEHLPIGDFEPNKDKIANLGIRLKQNSGVDILKVPFNFKVKSWEVINEVFLDDNKSKIATTIFTI